MTTTMVKIIGVTSWVALWGYYNIITPLQQKKACGTPQTSIENEPEICRRQP
jgi:hypothetical protein